MNDSPPIRFVMVGGFLGSGKTTTIARLARMFQNQGLNVVIVTNDQASGLVDTESLRSQGHRVGEVAGACFCCSFDQLISTVESLASAARPHVVLAEPVGSCTDLVATVVQPLVQLYSARFDVAPYGVILKPSHGRRILKGDKKSGFSPKAAYIFRKQLEEADFILINRIDELEPEEVEELSALVSAEQPDLPLLKISAKTGEGFDTLLELLGQRGNFGRRVLDIDYDVYAEGEAELGWLNSSLTIAAPNPFQLDELLLGVVQRLKESLAALPAETAHLKAIGLWEGFYGVANLVSSESEPELSLPSNCSANQVNLVVNARVALDPEALRRAVETAVESACRALGAQATWLQTQSFRPGRPVPTHRMTVQS